MRVSRRVQWYRDIIEVLLSKELTVRYRGSFLGYLWSLMNPLALAMVFYLVFGVVMKFSTPHYLVSLLSAMFPWQWYSNSIGQGPFLFLANATLVKKVSFPRQVIPLITNLQDMVHFILALPVYLGFMLADGLYPSWIWLWGIPVLSVVTLVSIYGVCLFVGTLNLFFRDLGNLVNIILNIAFYGTPIVYSLETIPAKYLIYFSISPVAPLFICWRSMLMYNTLNMKFFLLSVGYALIFLLIGLFTYSRLSRRFAETM